MEPTNAAWEPVTLLTNSESSSEEPDDEEVLYTQQRSRAGGRKSSSSDLLLGPDHRSDMRGRVLRDRRWQADDLVQAEASPRTRQSSCPSCAPCHEGEDLLGCNDICATKVLPVVSVVIHFLLFVAFPVHFVDLVVAGVDFPSPSPNDLLNSRRLLHICFYSTAILSAILSPLTVPVIGYKWTVVSASFGVSAFTLARCATASSAVAAVLLPLASALNGLTLGASLSAFRTQVFLVDEAPSAPVPSPTGTHPTPIQILRGSAAQFLSLHGSPAFSAVLWLALLLPGADLQHLSKPLQIAETPVPTTSSSVQFNISSRPQVLPREPNCGPEFHPNLTSYMTESTLYYTAGTSVYRSQALIGCYLIFSVAALLLSIAVLERSKRPSYMRLNSVDPEIQEPKDSESKSAKLFARCRLLLYDVIGQFVDRNRCLTLLVAVFLGSQQIFVYYVFLQSFPACYIDRVTSVLVGLTMSSASLVMTYPVTFLTRLIGRVKLVIAAFVLMTSLILVLLFADWMSTAAAMFSVASLWSLSECVLHIPITELIGILVVSHTGQHRLDSSIDQHMSVFTAGHLCGQLLMFLVGSQSSLSTSTAIFVLLGLTVGGLCCYVAVEISFRLDEQKTRESLAMIRTIQMKESDEATWLPLSSPMHSNDH